MAYDVEDKVVQMRFDNREFDPNIDASIKSLEKLERSLQLADGTKGLQNIEKSAKNFNLNPAVTAVESLKNGFSAMEVVAITAISNITNRAMAMGHQLINAFAIAPVKSGFAEYSEQMNSTQVIMSNLTDTTLPEVTAALDVLNEYADRTIYSFGQMTQAIGKFAAAGVDLGPATKAIQGLSSAAATVGANNQQLFSAYYNLAQSLQLGYMQLIDWKSLENSNIGNKTMRKAFVDTAIQMRKFTKDSEQAKKAYSDFRGSLSDKWLTTDVIIETLQKYSRQIKEIEGTYYEVNAAGEPVSKAFEEIRDAAGEVTGYITDTYGTLEAWEVELASTAFKAATEVKSFKQMWETLTEATGTGWAETWKIIFGDLEQAKHLWTEVSKPIEKVISVFNDVRNTALEAWAALGGREDLQATLINLSKAFGTLGDTIKMTVDKIFGTSIIEDANGVTREVSNLYLEFLKATRVLKIFSEYLIMSDEEIKKTSDSLATLLKPLRIVGKVLSFVGKAILSIIVMGVAIVQTIIDIAANLDIIPGIIDSIFGAGSWDRFLETLALVLNVVGNLAGLFFDLGTTIVHALGMAFDFIRDLLAGFLGVEAQSLHFANVFEFIGNAILFAINAVNNFITALREIIRAFDAFFKGDISSLGEAFGVARGTNFVQGVIIGAQNMAKPLAKIGSKLGIVLSSAFDKVLGIHSPARVGKKSGRFYGLGAAEGTEETEPEVEKAGEHLAESLNRGFTDRVKEAAKEYSTDRKDIFDLNDATKIEVSDNARQSLDRQLDQVQEFGDAVEEAGQNVDELQEDASTLEKIFTSVGSVISTIWDKVSTFISNISVGQVIIIAFASAVVLLVFNIARTIGEAKEVFEGFGRVLKATAGRIWAEAFDQISQALFNVAKAIALLVLVANFDPEGLKQAAIVMGIFLVAITALVVVFSRLVTVTDKLKSIKNAGEAIRSLGSAISKVFGLFSIAMMIAALSFSIMMLTNSLATLSQIDTASLWKGLAVLVILLSTMTAIIFILSKNTVQLTAGTVLIFAYSYALKLFSNALANISDGFSANIQKITSMTFKEIAVLISLVLGLTVLSVYINKASFALSKVILSLTLLAIGFGLVVAVMGIFKDNPLAESLIEAISDWRLWVAVGATAVVILAAFAIVSTQLAKVSKKTKTDLNKLYTGMTGLSKVFGQLSITLLVVMGGIAGIMAILSNSISKFGLGATAASFAMSVAIIGGVIGALILLVKVFIKASKDIKSNNIDEKVFSDISSTLRSITGSVIALTITMMALIGASMLFWKQYKDNPWQGILVLGTSLVILASIMGMIAGTIAVLGQNFKGDNSSGKNILAAMIPIIILVGELVGALALFSTFKDPRSLIPGIIAINAVMAPLIALIAVMGQLGNVFEKTDKNGFSSRNKDAKTVESLFKPLIAILVSVSVLMAEVSAMSILINQGVMNPKDLIGPLVAFYSIMGMLIPIIWGLNNLAEKIDKGTNPHHMVQSISRISLIVFTIGGMIATIMGSIVALSYFKTEGGFNSGGIVSIILTIGTVVGAAVFATTKMIKDLGNRTLDIKKAGIIILLLTVLSGIGVTIAGMVNSLRGIDFGTAIGEMIAFGAMLLHMEGMVAILLALTKLAEKVGNIRPVIILLSNLSGVIALLSGSLFLLKDIPANEFIKKAVTLMGAVAVVGALVAGLVQLSRIKSMDGKSILIMSVAIIAISSAVLMMAGAMQMLGSIPVGNVNNVIKLMWRMVAVFGILSGIFAAMAALISWIGPYSAIAIAVFGAMATGIIMFAAAITMLANAPLDNFISFFDNFAKENGKINATTQGLRQIVGAVFALAAAFTLGGPGFIIGSVFIFTIAAAMASLASTLSVLTSLSDGLTKLVTALSEFKGLLVPFGIFLGLLTLFAPGILIATLAINIILGSITIFIASLALLATGIERLTNVIMPFTEALRTAGLYIHDHIMSFVTLGVAIMGLGTACAVAAPGLLALAGAIGIIIVSIGLAAGIIVIALGAALALVTPFFATLIIGFVALTAVILVLKNTFIEFLDEMLLRAPQIISLLERLAPIANDLLPLGSALSNLGVGLITVAIGMVIGAVGILAMAGALKVLGLVVGSFENFVNSLKTLGDMSDIITTLGASFIVFGLGLFTLGIGSIAAAIGLLALTGVLVVMGKVIGSFEDFMANLMLLWLEGGKIAALGAAFIALGAGLAVLGVGSLVAGIGLLTLAGALQVISNVMGGIEGITTFLTLLLDRKNDVGLLGGALAFLALGLVALGAGLLVLMVPVAAFSAIITTLSIILMFVATVCMTLLAPAITAVALALTPCVLAFTALVNALALLNQTGNLMQLGLGLIFLAGGMFALGAASVIISLLATPMAILISLLQQISLVIPNVSKIITMFSTAIKIAALNIAESIQVISIAISQGIQQITEAISGVMNLAEQGANIAVNLIAGFTEGIDSTIGSIGDTMGKVINAIADPILTFFGIHSPADWFEWVADCCAAGFNQETLRQCPAFSNAGKAAGNAAGSGFLNTVKGWFQGSKVGNVITGGINKVKNGINNILGKDNKLAKGWQTVKDIFSGNFNFGDLAGKLGLDKIAENLDFSKATTGLDDFSSGLGDVGTVAQTTKGTLEELTDTIKNQMQIFERFNDEDIIDPKELIHNMESQLRGIRNWANGIDVLASRGASGDLIKYLSELGPQGYKYVESFLEMTGDQFAKANSLFTESLSLPDEAANTLLDGYRKSGAEIIEAVDQGISSGGGAAAGSFNDVMTDIEDQSSATSKQVLDDAIKAGDLSVEAIRMAGEDAIWAYKDGLWSWFSSEDYANMTEEAKAALGEVWSGKDIMDEMMKTGDHVDTTKSLFDHRYLESLAASDRAFYIDGWGKAVTGSQYVAESIKKGYLLPAAISNKVTAAEIGDLLGKTAVEWNAAAIEAGEGDLATGIEVLFGSAYDKAYPEVISTSEEFGANASNAIWDGFSEASKANYDRIAEQTRQYYNNLNEFQEEWYTAMYDRNSDYNSKMQKEYDLMMAQQKQIANDLAAGLTTKEAYAKAAKSGDEAWKAYNNSFRKSAQINSPSKEMEINAQYLIEGLANGIDKYMYMVTNASEELANNPINAISDTITQISSLFTEDLDAAPTITPILDMSNVESGASELDTLFSTQQAQIAANANIRYTQDDSVNRLKAAYADVLSKSNAELINAIQNTEQPINVNVVLQGDASTFFSAMVDQTRNTVASGGMNPFLITNRNSINAALV